MTKETVQSEPLSIGFTLGPKHVSMYVKPTKVYRLNLQIQGQTSDRRTDKQAYIDWDNGSDSESDFESIGIKKALSISNLFGYCIHPHNLVYPIVQVMSIKREKKKVQMAWFFSFFSNQFLEKSHNTHKTCSYILSNITEPLQDFFICGFSDLTAPFHNKLVSGSSIVTIVSEH